VWEVLEIGCSLWVKHGFFPSKAVWGCKHRGAEQVLLSKWLFKLMNEDGQWQQILRKKYLTNQTLGQVQKRSGDSQFWTGLMNVKLYFLRYRSFQHYKKPVDIWCFSRDVLEKCHKHALSAMLTIFLSWVSMLYIKLILLWRFLILPAHYIVMFF
jgi:hypothetical protein